MQVSPTLAALCHPERDPPLSEQVSPYGECLSTRLAAEPAFALHCFSLEISIYKIGEWYVGEKPSRFLVSLKKLEGVATLSASPV